VIRVALIAVAMLASYGAGATVSAVGGEVSGVGRTLQPFLIISVAILIVSITYAASTVTGILLRERRRNDEDPRG